MTPDDPGFYDILGNPGRAWFNRMMNFVGEHCCFVMRHDEGGVISPMPWDEVDEYLYGGEYDEVSDTQDDLIYH